MKTDGGLMEESTEARRAQCTANEENTCKDTNTLQIQSDYTTNTTRWGGDVLPLL